MKLKIYGASYVVLLSIFCYAINPPITEHIEFGLSLAGLVNFSTLNKFFVERTTDLSSQVVIPAIFLSFGFNRFYLQLIFGYLVYLLPFLAIWQFVNRLNNRILIFSLIFLLLILYKIPNWYYYPINFPIDFFEFGNSGLWMYLLCIGLLLNRNPLGFFLMGFLISWHLVWFFAISISFYPLVNKLKIPINRIVVFNFLLGLALSILLFKIGSDLNRILGLTVDGLSLQERLKFLLSPYLMVDGPFTGHNPIIFKNQSYKHTLVLFLHIFSPILILNIKSSFTDIENIRKNLLVTINILFLITFVLMVYLELSRYSPLIFAASLQRMIVNRYFDAIFIIGLIISIANISYSVTNKHLSKNTLLFLLYIVYFLSFNLKEFFLFIFVLIFIFIFWRNIIKNWLVKLMVLCLPFLIVSLFAQRSVYSAATYFKNTDDPVLIYLLQASSINDQRPFLLGWNVQSTSGMNISLFSKSSYFVAGKLDFTYQGETKSVYCYNNKAKNYFDLIANVDECFVNRSEDEWREIFAALNLRAVIVQKSVLLNLKLVAKNNLFNVFELSEVK